MGRSAPPTVPVVREGAAHRQGGRSRSASRRTTWEPLGASDETAARIEAQQAVTGEGPAIDAMTRARARAGRRPRRRSSAGGRASRRRSAPTPTARCSPSRLQIGAIAVGVLDLYRVEPIPLEPEDMTAMLAVADVVTMVLLSRTPPLDIGHRRRRGVVGPVPGVERDSPGHRHGGRPARGTATSCVSTLAGIRIRPRPSADGGGARRDRATAAIHP